MKVTTINKRKTNGITLIALIVTIIVLLILAGIVLALLVGDNKLLSKTEKSVEMHREKSALELLELKLKEIDIYYYETQLRKATFEDIVNELKKVEEENFIIWVEESSELAMLNGTLPDHELTAILVCNVEYQDIIFEIKNDEKRTIIRKNWSGNLPPIDEIGKNKLE